MRVLFSTTGADGHFLPLLPLASAVRAAGHDVVFATASSYAVRVRSEGFEPLPAGIDLDELERRFAPTREELRTTNLPQPERRVRAFSARFAEIEAPGKHEELFAAARAWRADAIVHESADLAGPLVGARLGVPTIHHSFGRMIPAQALRTAAEIVGPLWSRAGLTPDPLAGVYRGAYVDIWPPSLQRETPPAGVVVHRLRPVDRAADRPEQPPLAYVTLGTIFTSVALFRDLLEAFSPLGCSVLMTVGATVDPSLLAPFPGNAEVVGYVPQREILPRASVVVSHGGSGSTLGALAHGCPIVFVPQGADQFENALATADAGAGIVVMPKDQTVSNLREALQALLDDPSYAARAAAVADEIAALPSAAEVAGRLFGSPAGADSGGKRR
jgi:UDP:flavonoid glycosyltransferase YjiC (YdhE family)